MPCVAPVTLLAHSVNTGELQSAFVEQTALSGRQMPSGLLAASSGESVMRPHTERRRTGIGRARLRAPCSA